MKPRRMLTLKFSARLNSGVTLVEVMLTFFIAALVMACAGDVLRTGAQSFLRTRATASQDQDSAVALALLSKDIRTAYLSEIDPSTGFVGVIGPLGGELDLTRAAGFVDGSLLFERVRYQINADPRTGIPLLKRQVSGGAVPSTRVTDLCLGLADFKLTYFDGETWSDTWGWDPVRKKPYEGIKGLPVLVSIELIWRDSDFSSRSVTKLVPVMTQFLNRSFHA